MGAQWVGSDWKCDFICINNNHMEHACMIYGCRQIKAELDGETLEFIDEMIHVE